MYVSMCIYVDRVRSWSLKVTRCGMRGSHVRRKADKTAHDSELRTSFSTVAARSASPNLMPTVEHKGVLTPGSSM